MRTKHVRVGNRLFNIRALTSAQLERARIDGQLHAEAPAHHRFHRRLVLVDGLVSRARLPIVSPAAAALHEAIVVFSLEQQR